jgi:hypothetical protein
LYAPSRSAVVVELALRARRRPVEEEMLQEVRRAGGRRLLVDDAGADDDGRGDHRVRAVRDQDDAQPVVEGLFGGRARWRGKEQGQSEKCRRTEVLERVAHGTPERGHES